jgi:hypothetical protein
MTLKEARRRAHELFPGISASGPQNLVEVGRHESEGSDFFEAIQAMTPPGFPIPGLLRFGFTQLLELEKYGPLEKMRWGICFGFRGATFCFEHRASTKRCAAGLAQPARGLVEIA